MDLNRISQALDDEMADVGNDVVESQRSKGLRKSGQSADSLRTQTEVTADQVKSQLFGSSLLVIQEKGRKPNRSGKPSRKMVEDIAKWIPYTGKKLSPWAVATKIARDGIKVPNPFNPGGVLSEPLNPERVRDKLKAKLKAEVFAGIKSDVFGKSSSPFQ